MGGPWFSIYIYIYILIEEAQNFATSLLSTGLFVGHDAHGGSQNNVAELAGGQEVDDPLLDLVLGNIESGANNAALVEASRELNYDLAGPVIVDDLEFSNVSCWDYGRLMGSRGEGASK